MKNIFLGALSLLMIASLAKADGCRVYYERLEIFKTTRFDQEAISKTATNHAANAMLKKMLTKKHYHIVENRNEANVEVTGVYAYVVPYTNVLTAAVDLEDLATHEKATFDSFRDLDLNGLLKDAFSKIPVCKL